MTSGSVGIGADEQVDGRVRQRQHRQAAEHVVEPRVGELCDEPLELVGRRVEHDDLVEGVELSDRPARRVDAEHECGRAHGCPK